MKNITNQKIVQERIRSHIELPGRPKTDAIKEQAEATSFHDNKQQKFNEQHVLHELRHYLPSQTPLKDFIHHNSLHAFQDMTFYDGIFRASKIFGYQVTLQLSEFRELYKIGRIKKQVLQRIIVQRKGADHLEDWMRKLIAENYEENNIPRIGQFRDNWKRIHQIDLDNLVQPLLFRTLCSYLDQGIAVWKFPTDSGGFLASLRALETNSFSSFFKTKTVSAMLINGSCGMTDLLKMVVGDEALFEQYLFDQQFSHQGWSGIVSAIDGQPNTLLDVRKISLSDLICFELLLELDALTYTLGKNWQPLAYSVKQRPSELFTPVPTEEINETLSIWQDAFEWSYYDDVLAGIVSAKSKLAEPSPRRSFQALFCIDERECSLRRHIEYTDRQCETFGTPGFFSVEFFFKPANGQFYDKLCPQPVTPKYLIREEDISEKRKHDMLYVKDSHTLVAGFASTLTLGILSAGRMFMNLFKPVMSPAISNAFAHMYPKSRLTIENKHPGDRENDLQIGFSIEEMAARVESLLRSIGLISGFAPLVYVIGHGSSSANNPHHGAHDCGACSGRPGSVNARVFAFMANHPEVRALLASRDIIIPASTQFIGGLHDTAGDEIAFFDEQDISSENMSGHLGHVLSFEHALDRNAKERSRRFASINTRTSLKKVRKAIRQRSVSLFEPRPELGHGTNTLCIVGNRKLTKDLFLDRRAFLNSYNYATDPQGTVLTGIMKPLGPVCGGINLEYYFSRVDNHKLGAGTKLPHNVMGLIGVANSSDGDLRPGLPVQMIEAHDPLRLLLIVEHFPDVVLNAIQSNADMYQWYINNWVHLVAINPETRELSVFKDGAFTIYTCLAKEALTITDINQLIESAREMETNQIADATLENLPVYQIT